MLYGNKVRTKEGNVVHWAKHTNDTTMIDPRDENAKQIRQQRWLLLEVERQCFVVSGILLSASEMPHTFIGSLTSLHLPPER